MWGGTVRVNLSGALSDRKGFTDASRAPILAKLCTFTCETKLILSLPRGQQPLPH